MSRNNFQNRITANLFMLFGIPVLMYHHIGTLPPNADAMRKDLTVSSEDFNKQLDYLQKNGYQSITTQQLYDSTQGKFDLPKKPIVLTFDDGYKDTFANAVPRLNQHHMQGVFAIVTDYQALPDYADWTSIQGAQVHGMEIIPHTRHHVDLKSAKYSHQDRLDEMLGSITDIKAHLGTETTVFVYPYGNYDDEAVNILKNLNVKIAFTTKFGLFQSRLDMLTEPRVRVHGTESIAKFAKSLSGVITKEQFGPRVPKLLLWSQAEQIKLQ